MRAAEIIGVLQIDLIILEQRCADAGAIAAVGLIAAEHHRRVAPQSIGDGYRQLQIDVRKHLVPDRGELGAQADVVLGRTAIPFVLAGTRSEEHTSELQSLMRISYAVFCLKKKTSKTLSIHVVETMNSKLY